MKMVTSDIKVALDILQDEINKEFQKIYLRFAYCAAHDCQALFLKMRQKQKFCSSTCQSRVAVARFRAQKKEAQWPTTKK